MGVLLGFALAILLGWVIKCVCSGEWSSNGGVKDDSSAFSIARDQVFHGTYKEWLVCLSNDGKSVAVRNVPPNHALLDEHAEYWWFHGVWTPSYKDMHGFQHRLGIPYRNPYVPYSSEWLLIDRGFDGEMFHSELRRIANEWHRARSANYVIPDLRRRVEKQMRTHKLRPARARQVTV